MWDLCEAVYSQRLKINGSDPLEGAVDACALPARAGISAISTQLPGIYMKGGFSRISTWEYMTCELQASLYEM